MESKEYIEKRISFLESHEDGANFTKPQKKALEKKFNQGKKQGDFNPQNDIVLPKLSQTFKKATKEYFFFF